ncbi:hypothetical protein GCM10011506_37950 [Marivirga lumbricoides]|uniref:Uncharacterized protein n=1 Tax=Marivirga lumbricoides TaxID=1046115 RepID=A0A2T4DP20_9BACT|nr:hypothetical protein C9994_11205 [Marivirga lumbricoides]GGC48731.1 hypothetical protein GCM10011506_37950 [Marivirga lumbricoides]
MKKVIGAFVVYAVAMFSLNSAMQTNKAQAAKDASSLRVLDYTWNCVGSGGNCLDTVVVTPKKN